MTRPIDHSRRSRGITWHPWHVAAGENTTVIMDLYAAFQGDSLPLQSPNSSTQFSCCCIPIVGEILCWLPMHGSQPTNGRSSAERCLQANLCESQARPQSTFSRTLQEARRTGSCGAYANLSRMVHDFNGSQTCFSHCLR